MWGRILEILRKEFFQVMRDPRMRVVLFGPPLVELLVFGYAVTLDVEKNHIGWMDRDNSYESRELQSCFEASRYFQITAMPDTDKQVRNLLDREEVVAVVNILPGFGGDIHRGKTVSVQVLVDGTNSNTATMVSSYSNDIIEAFGERLRNTEETTGILAAQAKGVFLTAPKLNVQSRVWFNPDLKSRNYFVPGVLVSIIAYVTLMLTAMSIVREREIGTMEQLLVTPMRPVELIIGKLLPYAAIGIFDVVLVTAAALIVFHTPFRGSFILLLSSTILFLLATLGAGLFISTISRTQQQALIGSFFFLLPALLLSGFAFPIQNMTLPVRILTYLNPLRYFMEIVRGIFLKGSGLDLLWPSMTALAVIGITILALSVARFRKRLD